MRGAHEPVAIKTSLGWVLSEPLKGKSLGSIPECSLICCHMNPQQETLMSRYRNFGTSYFRCRA